MNAAVANISTTVKVSVARPNPDRVVSGKTQSRLSTNKRDYRCCHANIRSTSKFELLGFGLFLQ